MLVRSLIKKQQKMGENIFENVAKTIYKPEKCFENWVAMANLEPNDILTVTNQMKEKTNYYKEEIAKMEAVFLKLGLNNHENCSEMLEKLGQLQDELNSEELSLESAIVSHSHQLRKNNNYLAKLKICIKMYVHLNETLAKNIKSFKNELEESKTKSDGILCTTAEEIKVMEGKIQRHEKELFKLEKKYPWLKKHEYDLPNISNSVAVLNDLKLKKLQLVKELDVYCGLKPDLGEAIAQVNHIKVEYQQVGEKLIHAMKR